MACHVHAVHEDTRMSENDNHWHLDKRVPLSRIR